MGVFGLKVTHSVDANTETRLRGLEATVDRLIDRIDRLEAVVLALCEQDGEVSFPLQESI